MDQSNGDLYVADSGVGSVIRFTSAGGAHNFTAVEPYISGNRITGQTLGGAAENQLAVDNALGSPFEGDLYVTTNGGAVKLFAPSGEEIGGITGFGEACGVAVDQSTGDVYVGDYGNAIWRFEPISNTTPVTNTNYVKTGVQPQGLSACQVGTDTSGHAYGMNWSSGPLQVFNASDFSASPPSVLGTEINGVPSNTVYTDPQTDELYVDEGNKIGLFDSTGTRIQTFGSGSIAESRGVAVNGTTKHVYASTGSKIVEFGAEQAPYLPIDNPAVLHAVVTADTHTYGDFQTTADGRFAAFGSLQPLTGYDNDGHYEVFRYAADVGTLTCASCNPTNARAQGSSTLPRSGLGLAKDGHLFFNSNDPIAARDLDNKQDAYEWDGSAPQLLSTGLSPFDSSLLGVSADGNDAYFFTRDVLVPQDKNGSLVKLYDARAEGGFPFLPPTVQCKASDECHGAGSQPPGPLPINTITGDAGNRTTKHASGCRAGSVRRHGRCVKRKHHRARRKRLRNESGRSE